MRESLAYRAVGPLPLVRQHPLVDQVIAQWSFDALLVVAAMVVVAVFGPARRSREPDSEPSRPQPARSA